MQRNGNQKKPGMVRRVIGDLLILAAVLLTVSVCVTMLRRIDGVVLKNDYRSVFRYQLILCGVLVLFALDLRFGFFTRLRPAALKAVGWVLRVVVVLLAVVTIAFSGKVIIGGMVRTAGEADYAIVLGMALEHEKPAPDLIRRLDTAQKYLEEHPDATLILTGGNAGESGLTEAAVMFDTLLERGIPADKMLLEDEAADTRENFRKTAEFLDPGQPVVLISSNYHMDRAVRIAGEAGFTKCLRLPASSGLFTYGANVLSEVVLDINDLTKGR